MSPDSTSRAPVVILGAARSGTKLLRSIVAASTEFAEVPHDVNYVWRTLAPQHPNDALPATAATAANSAAVRRLLQRMAGITDGDARRFVEKTVSNTLRTPLVDRVLPDALFIHLVRDGRDVTESALRCWQAPPEMGRLADKLRTFPWRACSGYALSYARGMAVRYLSGEKRLPVWGPRYQGVERDLRTLPLPEVCAWQWRRTVEAARFDLQSIPSPRWIEVRYEDLAADPVGIANRIAGFLGVDATPLRDFAAARVVTQPARDLPPLPAAQADAVEAILSPLRAELGYAARRAAA